MATNTSNAVSQTPLFGRAWEFVVNLPNGGDSVTVTSSAWEPEALRMTFAVDIKGIGSGTSFWFARVELYNLSPVLSAQLLSAQGGTVELSAGYQVEGRFGVIFKGEIYQAMFERVDVVDAKVTLMCYTGLSEVMGNFASVRGNPNMTQTALIQSICAAANTPITIDSINTTAIASTQLPRPRAFFGDPHRFIDDVASANKLVSWYGFDGLGVSPLNAAADVPEITYDGTSGQIIGTPVQTQDGLDLTVLLDPRLRVAQPMQMLELVNTGVAQLAYEPPGVQPYLDPAGKYLVLGLRQSGDTKGGEWLSHVTCLTSIGGRAAMLTDIGGDPVDPRSPR